MTQAIRTFLRVDETGHLSLPPLPQAIGQEVEVIVLVDSKPSPDLKYPLRGMPYRYDDPCTPAIRPEDWDPSA